MAEIQFRKISDIPTSNDDEDTPLQMGLGDLSVEDDTQISEEVITEASSDEVVPNPTEQLPDDPAPPTSPHYYIALELQERGELPPDLEITPDITYQDIIDNYRKAVSSPIKQEIEAATKEALLERGWKDEDLFYVNALKNGVDPTIFQPAERMRQYGQLDIQKMDDDSKKIVVRSMYNLRNTPEDEVELLITAREERGELDTLASSAIEFHKQGYSTWRQQEEARLSQIEAEKEKDREALKRTINDTINSRTIGGINITHDQAKTLHDDIFVSNEVVDVEGNKMKVPAVNKFLYQFQNDVKLQLELYAMWKFRDNLKEQAQESAVGEIEKKMIEARGRVIKDNTAPKEDRPLRVLATFQKNK